MKSTRDRLIETAALLFRQRGYDGVGIAEILKAARVPKGSLYHHFRNGKADLALASARWASDGMMRIIDDAFDDAADFNDGATTLCHKLAKFFDISGGWDGCPVSSILLDASGDPTFRDALATYLDDWVDRAAAHGTRLGLDGGDAARRAKALMLSIQGAWVVARARQHSGPIRQIPDILDIRAS